MNRKITLRNLMEDEDFLLEDDLLLEDRVGKLKKVFSGDNELNKSHDPQAAEMSSSDIIDHFAAADPTKQKKFTPWLVKQYHQGHIKIEDAPNAADTIESYNRYQQKLEQKDFNQYQHIGHLRSALQPLEEEGTKSSLNLVRRSIPGADLIYDHPHVTVHHVTDKDAAIQLGKRCEGGWCVSRTDEHNAFDSYTHHGNFYVVHDVKNDDKYGGPLELGYMADRTNSNIPLKDIAEKVPSLVNVPEFQNHSIHFNTPESRRKLVTGYVRGEHDLSNTMKKELASHHGTLEELYGEK